MKTKTYQGLINQHSWGEVDDILFLSTLSDPLAETLQDDIANKRVTVRYWVSDKPATKEEAVADFVKTLSGMADCDFGSRYSEITGYLWTDEDCKIGGHDLLKELRNNAGKWLILEVDVHDS